MCNFIFGQFSVARKLILNGRAIRPTGLLFYVVSDTSPMYTISKQSDHCLWRYCILKIWGIQKINLLPEGSKVYPASGQRSSYPVKDLGNNRRPSTCMS